MRFGLFIPFHRLDPSESIQQVYADALEQVLLAEESGFDMVWFPEHHLSNMIACPRPLTAVTWAAQHTSRIRLGTGVLVLPYYHPLNLAEEVGMVDALTGGRLEVGIGRGGYNYEYVRYGTSEEDAAARLRECTEAALAVWNDQDTAFSGRYWSFPPTAAVPKPIQRPHPPIWVAARSVETIRWSLEHGFNLLATPQREPLTRLERYVQTVQGVTAEVKPAGRSLLGVSRMTYVTEDPADARRAMDTVWTNHCVNRHLHLGSARVWQGHIEPDPLPPEVTLSTDALLENLVVGDPETCVRKLREYEALGVDQYLVYADLGIEQERIMRSLRLFVREVMPHFAASPAGAPA